MSVLRPLAPCLVLAAACASPAPQVLESGAGAPVEGAPEPVDALPAPGRTAEAPQSPQEEAAHPEARRPRQGPPRGSRVLPREVVLVRGLRSANTWKDRLARDEALSFGPGAAQRALQDLDLFRLAPEDVPGALIAIGAGGGPGDLGRLISYVETGEGRPREAAVLALGELGEPALVTLRALAEAPPDGLGEFVGLAYLTAGGAEARAFLEEAALDPGHPLHRSARLLTHADPELPPVHVTSFGTWLLWRWHAGQRYGSVEGTSWRSLLLEELLSEEAFKSRFVLEAAVRPETPTLRGSPSLADHLYEVALRDGPPQRLAPVVAGIPEVLGVYLRGELWAPGGMNEWRVLLRSIDERRLERRALELLRSALRFPALEADAGRLLLRAGDAPPANWFARRLSGGPAETLALVEALGASGDPQRVEDLLRILGDEESGPLYAACTVALARIGHAPAVRRIEEIFLGPTDALLLEFVSAMIRAVDSRRIRAHLEQALLRTELPPEVRTDVELALAKRGSSIDRPALRRWLSSTRQDPRRVDVVRLLADGALEEDLDLLREMFPTGEDRDVDLELALALLSYREPVALRVLRDCLWTTERDVGIVAAGLFAEALGVRALEDELETPPAGTTDVDQRRLGFAIGRFGGSRAVEDLARRRTSTDPALQGAYLGLLSTRTQ